MTSHVGWSQAPLDGSIREPGLLSPLPGWSTGRRIWHSTLRFEWPIQFDQLTTLSIALLIAKAVHEVFQNRSVTVQFRH